MFKESKQSRSTMLKISFGILLVCMQVNAACVLDAPLYIVSHGDVQTTVTCIYTCSGKNVSEYGTLNWKTNLTATAVFQEKNRTTISSTLQMTPHLQHGLDRLDLKLQCKADESTSMHEEPQSVTTTILVCAPEQLNCHLHNQTGLYNISCIHKKSKCGTTVRCEVNNKLLKSPEQNGDVFTYMYSDVDVKEDNISCYLYHPDMNKAQRIEIQLNLDTVTSKTTPKPVTTTKPLTTPCPFDQDSKELGKGLFLIIGIGIGIIIVVVLLMLCRRNDKFCKWFIGFFSRLETATPPVVPRP